MRRVRASAAATSAPALSHASLPHLTSTSANDTPAHADDAVHSSHSTLTVSHAASQRSARVELIRETHALSAQLSSVDTTLHSLAFVASLDDPHLTRRAYDYSTSELPALIAANAHRRRDLAALAIEARNPLSHLNALPTLGPLQMVEEFVRRGSFRAGVVSDSPAQLLQASSPSPSAPYRVAVLKNGTFLTNAISSAARTQLFDSRLQCTASVSVPSMMRGETVRDLTLTQQDNVVFVVGDCVRIASVDSSLVASFRVGRRLVAQSAAETSAGEFLVLSTNLNEHSDSGSVHVFSGTTLTQQYCFALDNTTPLGLPRRVRVTADGDIVIARHTGLQVYRRDGTLIRQLDGSSVSGGTLEVMDVAVDAESNFFVSDFSMERVCIFRADGKFTRAWGSDPATFRPRGVAVTAGGHIAVCNCALSRLELWS